MIRTILYIFTFINILIYFYIIIIAASKWYISKAHRRFFLASLFAMLWIVDTVTLSIHTSFSFYKIIASFNFFLAALIAAMIVSFSLHFPRNHPSLSLRKEFLLLLPLFIIALLSFTDLFFKVTGFREAEKVPGYFLYIAILIFYFIFVAGLTFIKKYKQSVGIIHQQLKYISIGYLTSMIVLLIQSLIMNLKGDLPIDLDLLSSNSTIFFSAFAAYVMLRYRFLDARVIIRKGVIYLVSLIVALSLYTYLALILKTTIEQYWNISAGWTAFILVALVALGFSPLKSLVERSINILFRGKKSIDLAVKEVREKMAVKTDTDSLIDLIVQEIRKYLELKEVKLFLIDHQKQKFIYNSEESRQEIELDSELVRYFDKYPDILVREEIQHLVELRNGRFDKEILQKVEKQMKKEKAGLIIPFKTEEEVFCLILIGDRQDNQAYTVQDIEFLEKLREQVSFTLANALLYKEALARIQAEAKSKNY